VRPPLLVPAAVAFSVALLSLADGMDIENPPPGWRGALPTVARRCPAGGFRTFPPRVRVRRGVERGAVRPVGRADPSRRRRAVPPLDRRCPASPTTSRPRWIRTVTGGGSGTDAGRARM